MMIGPGGSGNPTGGTAAGGTAALGAAALFVGVFGAGVAALVAGAAGLDGVGGVGSSSCAKSVVVVRTAAIQTIAPAQLRIDVVRMIRLSRSFRLAPATGGGCRARLAWLGVAPSLAANSQPFYVV
jgi:hypothetical protein